MAMLSWTKLNPTVRQVSVKKLFYNKYLYKIKVFCPGSRMLDAKNEAALVARLESRLEVNDRMYNYGGSWYMPTTSRALKEHGRLTQLFYFYNLRNNNNLKIRIEEPHLSIYSNSQMDLYNIIQECMPDRLLEVHYPINDRASDILQRGHILVNLKESFEYKIVLKQMIFDSLNIKHSILDHLYNLDDQVRITARLKSNLNNMDHFFPGGYFYTKDDKIVTFINLICPNIISSIFKLTKL